MRAIWGIIVVAGCGRIGFGELNGDGGGLGGGDGGGDAANHTGDGPTSVGPRPAANLAFVTSDVHAPATLGSLAAADAICQQRADGAGLTGTYIAWLAASGSDPTQRLQKLGARGFVRMDGLAIADTPTMSFDLMWRPVAFDETGAPVPPDQPVMTGVSTVSASTDCAQYTRTTGQIAGGYADATSFVFGSGTNLACSGSYRLYCFETDRAVPTSITPMLGRAAFVATAAWTPGGGINAADAACASAATAGMIPGTFLALLATSTTPAAARFTAVGSTWVLPDGVPIADTAAAVLAGQFVAPINVGPPGQTFSGGPVAFGAADMTTPGTAASTCADWTVSDTTAQMPGEMASTGPHAFVDPAQSIACDTASAIYCLEK